MLKINRLSIFFIKITISIIFLYHLFLNNKIEINSILFFYNNIFEFILLLLFLFVFLYVPIIIRWKLLLSVLNIKICFLKLVKIGLIAQFVTVLIAGSLGADAVKTFYLIKESNNLQNNKYNIIFCTIFDKIIGLVSLLLLCLFAFLSNYINVFILFIIICVTFFLIFYIFFIINNLFKVILYIINNNNGFIAKFKIFINYYKDKYFILTSAFFISFFVQINLSLLIYFITNSVVGVKISIYDFFIISPLAELSSIIPISPFGIGIGHFSYQTIFELFGQSGGANVFNSLLFLKISFSLLGLLPFLINKK